MDQLKCRRHEKTLIYKEAIDFLKKCELHKDVIAMAKKTAQGAKEAAAASVKKVFKNTKTSPLT